MPCFKHSNNVTAHLSKQVIILMFLQILLNLMLLHKCKRSTILSFVYTNIEFVTKIKFNFPTKNIPLFPKYLIKTPFHFI